MLLLILPSIPTIVIACTVHALLLLLQIIVLIANLRFC